MFSNHLNKGIIYGFVIAGIILIWLSALSYLNTQRLVTSSKWVAHTNDVLFHAERILAVSANIELGQRGFALTGDERFLGPYHVGKDQVRKHLSSISELSKDNDEQQVRLARLQPFIVALIAFADSAVNERKIDFERARQLNASLRGQSSMDSIRSIITEFQDEENRLLHTRIQEHEMHITNFNQIFVALLLVSILILLLIGYATNASFKLKNEAAKKLSEAYREINKLYDEAPCGYHSLDKDGYFRNINTTMLKWLGFNDKSEVIGKIRFVDLLPPEAVKEFTEFYRDYTTQGGSAEREFMLMRRDRTLLPVLQSSSVIFDDDGKFVQTNSSTFDHSARKQVEQKADLVLKELESFSYSVSHDLRAPLRSIDGYTRILVEDYSDKLDGEGKRVLNVIINNARRMGNLIDDLLEFSRLGRKDIAFSKADMTLLVDGVFRELLESEKDRNISWRIEKLEPAWVDVEMMRLVWLNLISNALKYTGKTANPVIKVDSYIENKEIVYRISDNGVGFEMQYVDKLFGVFQRLHKIHEFTGTGVGLAIVKRIVTRHNGRVWAEAELDKGATFYFSLPYDNGK